MILNNAFSFLLVIGVMLVGIDFITKKAGLGAQARYRRAVRAGYNFFRRHLLRLIRWAWREYKQFILGTALGILATLYITGHFG